MTIELPRTPSFQLDGRRALITGGGRGIGLAAAAALAEARAHVTLAARTKSEIEEAADTILSEGGSADAIVLDMLDTAAVKDAVAAAKPFDILINNAGPNRPKTMADTTEEAFDAILGLNLRAAYFVTQAVTNKMLAAKIQGSVINISSQMGHVGGPLRTVYCSSKWAVEGFTKSLDMELGPHGIRVNSIAPTVIETPLAKEMLKDSEFRNAVISKIKLGRIGEVEDLMGAIVFLASDAARMITGASLLIDGGWTIG